MDDRDEAGAGGAEAAFEALHAQVVVMRQAVEALPRAMNDQRQQLKWLLWTGFGALLLGVLISPVFVRLLPFGWDGQVAAFILRGDRWEAGGRLMMAADPKVWADLSEGARVWTGNKAAIETCRDAAIKTKKEQHCAVVVSAP